MLYILLYSLHTQFSVFNVFRYITFRAILAILTALIISLILGPWLIRKLQRLKVKQFIRNDGPASHLGKEGTPTMGGILILAAIIVAVVLWADLKNFYIWITLLVIISFGALGFWDDYLKITRRNPKGVSGKKKFGLQGLLGIGVALLLYFHPMFKTTFSVPFF